MPGLLRLLERVSRIITHPYVSKLIQTVLIPLIRILITQMSVKENQINPQLALVALTNVTL